MDRHCDHNSAGVLVEKDGKILIIERKKFPAGFALPAGHPDGDDFQKAALRELREETGIEALKLELLLNEEVKNPCRRKNGTRHHWQVFHASQWRGELKQNNEETKSIRWANRRNILSLAKRTEIFAKKHDTPLSDIALLTAVLSQDPKWQSSPGLEPVWFYFLKRLNKIK